MALGNAGARWGLPKHFGQQFTRCLQTACGLELKMGGQDTIIIAVPTGRITGPWAHSPQNGRWYMIHDNGGEFTVWEINSVYPPTSIPYTHFLMDLTPGTMAQRVALEIRGEEIDWNRQYLTQEETTALLT